MNEYVNSDEYVFIQYHDIIKSYKPKLLSHMLYSDYRKGYDGCIDFNKFKDYSDNQLLGLSIKSADMNILKYLSISEFNYELCLYDIKSNIPNLYRESKLLDMGESLKIMSKESYVKKIYIHTPEKDERILRDLEEIYSETEKMVYVVGDTIDVIKDCPDKLTTFILNDASIIDSLIDIGKIQYTTVLIADCGWNYTIDEKNIPYLKIENLDAKMKEHIFKCGTFKVSKQAVY